MKTLLEIVGPIGRGKSVLLAALSDAYAKVVEPVEGNPWLECFYAEMDYMRKLKAISSPSWPARTTPLMEIHLQANRKLALEAAFEKSDLVATDYVRPGIYARCLMWDGVISQLDYQCFFDVERATEIYGIKRHVIYLKGVDRALANIGERGRECERGIRREYLELLERSTEAEEDSERFVFVKWGIRDGYDEWAEIEYALEKMGLPSELKSPVEILGRKG